MTQAVPGAWVTQPDVYRRQMEEKLAGRAPLEVLGQTADVLEAIVARHPAATMRARPFAGKWTPNEIIGHLSDSEWVYGYRLRLILCETEPTILGMDQDLWVAGQRHNERAPKELVTMFRQLRVHNLAIWRQTSEADLKRVGQHNERGAESLGTMLRMLAGHDLHHIDQIERYLVAEQKSQ